MKFALPCIALATLIAAPAWAEEAATFANPTPVDWSKPVLYDGMPRETYQRQDLLNRRSLSVESFVRGLSEVGVTGGESPRNRGGTGDGVATINLRGLGGGISPPIYRHTPTPEELLQHGPDFGTFGTLIQGVGEDAAIAVETYSREDLVDRSGGDIAAFARGLSGQ